MGLHGGRSVADANTYFIPDEIQVHSLLDQYFTNTNILYPFINQESFLATYENALRSNFDGIRRTWLGLLNILMAFGSITSVDPKINGADKIQSAEVFYKRAHDLCLFDAYALRSACLETGQSP